MNKKICRLLVSFILIASIVVQTNATDIKRYKTQFTQAELLEDYDQLWADLEINYPFYKLIESYGVNLIKLKNDNRELLTSRITDINGFVYLINDTLRRMKNVAHLSLVSPESYYDYKAIASLYPFAPRDEMLMDTQTQAIYNHLMSAKENTKTYVKANVIFKYFDDIETAYFYFGSFDYSLMERDKQIVEKSLALYGNVKHIIFDITGNGGGANDYWIKNIVSPFGGEYSQDNYVFLKNSPINIKYLFDYEGLSINSIDRLPVDYSVPVFVGELGFTHFYVRQDAYKFTDTLKLAGSPKRWVLIDEYVFSAADGFTHFCKATQWATLVGKNTLGDGADGLEPALLALKNTGLLIRFSSTAGVNQDGTLNAVIGTSPDIYSEKNKSPLDTCIRMIKRLSRYVDGRKY
jgi:hypothetical protein